MNLWDMYIVWRRVRENAESDSGGRYAYDGKILELVHDTEVPLLSYNHETELSAIVNLVYLAARDSYRVEREDKGGS